MRRHIDISRMVINFLKLKNVYIVELEEIAIC